MSETQISERNWTGPLLVLLGGICIGFAPIALREGVSPDMLGPQAVAMWRFLFAIPILFALVLLIQKRLPVRPNKFIFMAGTFFALNIAFWHWSLVTTTVSNATFVVSLGNLFAGFTAWVFLKNKPHSMWFLAVFVALLGAGALTQGGGEDGKGMLSGDLLAVIAAVFVSLYLVCSKVARRTISGIEVIFWLTCVELVVFFLIVGISGETYLPKNFPESYSGFYAPLFLALVAQVMGQGLIVAGLGTTPASVAGVLVVVQPVVATAIAWGRYDEPLVALQIGGGILILIAMWLASQKPKSPKSKRDVL